MSKPTENEMQTALDEAAYMREHSNDPRYLAKTLLNMNYRLKYLEKVFKAAERYLYFGMEDAEHQRLLKEMEHARSEELRIDTHNNSTGLGL
jgi:hypothetical protein